MKYTFFRRKTVRQNKEGDQNGGGGLHEQHVLRFPGFGYTLSNCIKHIVMDTCISYLSTFVTDT